jgi:phage gp36-like protein
MNFSSHISNSQHRSKIRESMQSQSSLRYSMLSNNRDKTMELELSEAGESFFDQNQSMISNVSEVFGRDEFPYEKMQLKRVEQRRLF